jgi:hypothetical protein
MPVVEEAAGTRSRVRQGVTSSRFRACLCLLGGGALYTVRRFPAARTLLTFASLRELSQRVASD